VTSNGEYGTEPGLITSFPIRTLADGTWQIVEGLEIDAYSQSMIDKSVAELASERETVQGLGIL
jgi:malate dehydrogenase